MKLELWEANFGRSFFRSQKDGARSGAELGEKNSERGAKKKRLSQISGGHTANEYAITIQKNQVIE